jgi:tellurite resistance protein TerC
VKEAALWSVVWVTLALAFNFGLYRYLLHRLPNDPRLIAIPGFDPAATAWEIALQFLAGYVVEYSLSVDNIFVFVVVMNYFAIPSEYQHRVLFFGILGALVFRAIFIAIGAALMQYQWVIWIFGVFLIFTGVRMMFAKEEGVEPEENAMIRLFKKRVPVTNDFHEQKFFVNIDGRKHATPLFIALLFLEMTDIVFAVDSVPAIFALTREPLIVFTSNIFAILGLRNLYFMLRGAIDKFHMLKYGLGIVLIFVGAKMTFLGRLFKDGHVPIELSLGVILGVIFLSILASLIFPQRPHEPGVPPLPMPFGHQAMTHDVHVKSQSKGKGEAKEKKS